MKWKKIIILFVTLCVYLCVGAGIFYALESPNEEDVCEATKVELREGLKTFRKDSLVGGQVSASDIRALMDLVQSAAGNGVTLNDVKEPECSSPMWNYGNAFFFCVTMVTTIGYGNFAPATSGGKAFCVIYAFFGIPIFGVMLISVGAKIAHQMEKFNNKVVANVVRGKEGGSKSNVVMLKIWGQVVILVASIVFIHIFFLLIPAGIISAVEGWDYAVTLYFTYITLTTIGLGDFVAGFDGEISQKAIYMIFVYAWILVGLGGMSILINVTADFFAPFEQMMTNIASNATFLSGKMDKRSKSFSKTSQDLSA